MAKILIDQLGDDEYSSNCVFMNNGDYLEYAFNLPTDYKIIDIVLTMAASSGETGNISPFIGNSNPIMHESEGDLKKIAMIGLKSGDGFVGENGNKFVGVCNTSEDNFVDGWSGYFTGGNSPKPVAFNNAPTDNLRVSNNSTVMYVDENGNPSFSTTKFNIFVGGITIDQGLRTVCLRFVRQSTNKMRIESNIADFDEVRDSLPNYASVAMSSTKSNANQRIEIDEFVVGDNSVYDRVFIYCPDMPIDVNYRIHNLYINTY
jgi:hypothetical protein